MYKTWSDFYRPICGNRELLIGNIETHAPFIDILMKYSMPGDSILEVGSGTGVLAAPLAITGRKITSLDKEQEILDMAAKNAHELGVKIEYRRGDAFQLPSPFTVRGYISIKGDGEIYPFAIAYSHGLLEHSKQEEMLDLVERQLDCAPLVFAVMPLKGATGEQYGDERMESDKWWWDIFAAPCPVRWTFRHLYKIIIFHKYLNGTMLVMGFARKQGRWSEGEK